MKFVIFGAGGFGREVLNFVLRENFNSSEYEFIGFVDEYEKIIGTSINGYKVFKPEEFSGVSAVCAIGNTKMRKEIFDKYSSRYNFINLIHPDVFIPDNVKIGTGNIICEGCKFTTDIVIGDNNIFNIDTTIGHDCIIGNGNVFMANITISGNVTFGDRNLIGSSSTVIQNRTIGSDSIIGIGSTVLSNVPDNVTVMGYPARIVEKR
jgi:sugar O-acyltransferase (sialic acid O-acetyltransferase NeuD family)